MSDVRVIRLPPIASLAGRLAGELKKGRHVCITGAIYDRQYHQGAHLTSREIVEKIIGSVFDVVTEINPIAEHPIVIKNDTGGRLTIDGSEQDDPFEVAYSLLVQAEFKVLVVAFTVGLLVRDPVLGDDHDRRRLAFLQAGMRDAARRPCDDVGNTVVLVNPTAELPREVLADVGRVSILRITRRTNGVAIPATAASEAAPGSKR